MDCLALGFINIIFPVHFFLRHAAREKVDDEIPAGFLTETINNAGVRVSAKHP